MSALVRYLIYALIPALESMWGGGGIKRVGLQTCDSCSPCVKLQVKHDEAQPLTMGTFSLCLRRSIF